MMSAISSRLNTTRHRAPRHAPTSSRRELENSTRIPTRRCSNYKVRRQGSKAKFVPSRKMLGLLEKCENLRRSSKMLLVMMALTNMIKPSKIVSPRSQGLGKLVFCVCTTVSTSSIPSSLEYILAVPSLIIFGGITCLSEKLVRPLLGVLKSYFVNYRYLRW